jgi:putative nucleotidyltransferase with HDIG domain
MYRCQQFFSALFARISDDERALVQLSLSPTEVALFEAMTLADRRHCLDVHALLVKWGFGDPELLRAALLHDIGKSTTPIRLWHRVVIVLAGKARINRLASGAEHTWRFPFLVHRNHAVLGATLAAQAGCSPRVIDLIRGHGGPGADEQSQALFRADEMC